MGQLLQSILPFLSNRFHCNNIAFVVTLTWTIAVYILICNKSYKNWVTKKVYINCTKFFVAVRGNFFILFLSTERCLLAENHLQNYRTSTWKHFYSTTKIRVQKLIFTPANFRRNGNRTEKFSFPCLSSINIIIQCFVLLFD